MDTPDIGLDQIQEIADAANLDDVGARAYSGRGMYGQWCVGVVLDDVSDFALLMVFAVDVFGLDAGEYLASQVKTDAMGRSQVYYWPGLKVEV